MRKNIFIAGILAALSVTAAAADDTRIEIKDYDINNKASLRLLHADIVTAAHKACSNMEFVGIFARQPKIKQQRDCMRWTVNSALKDAKLPALKALHASLPRDQRFNVQIAEDYAIASIER